MQKTFLILLTVFLFISNAVYGQSADELYETASNLYDQKKYSEALVYLNRALKKDSTNGKYLLLKGNAYERSKKYQEAFDVYSYGIAVNQHDSYMYNQRGLLLKKIQQTEDAIKDFTTALDFEKTDSLRLTLYLNRGAARIAIRDFDRAYEDFVASLKIDSLNIGTLNNLASVCDETGRGNETLKYLFKILEIDSTFIGAWGNIGFKYQEIGDYKKAISYFNKVLQLDPNEPLAYSNRAFNWYKLGDYDAALKDINMSLKLYPANSYAWRNRALIYIVINEKGKACKDIDEALRLGFTKMYGDEVETLKNKYCSAAR